MCSQVEDVNLKNQYIYEYFLVLMALTIKDLTDRSGNVAKWKLSIAEVACSVIYKENHIFS